MSTYDRDKELATDSDAYYELRASQEEIYLETTEEQVSEILDSDIRRFSEGSGVALKERGDEQSCQSDDLNRAAEELITGDADDPPISDDAVA